MLTHQNEGQKY